jgi:cysteine sulfinate desulfinase/cysteine desulfurase-like protein
VKISYQFKPELLSSAQERHVTYEPRSGTEKIWLLAAMSVAYRKFMVAQVTSGFG